MLDSFALFLIDATEDFSQLAETGAAPLSSRKVEEDRRDLIEGEPISINPETESVSCVAEQPKKNEGNVEVSGACFYLCPRVCVCVCGFVVYISLLVCTSLHTHVVLQ